MSELKILAINPGSTSTKIALYHNEKEVFIKSFKHSIDKINEYETIADQFSFREEVILAELKDAGIDISELDAVVGRGGLVKPIESGVYEVNDALIRDLKNPPLGEHASNLGGLIADHMAKSIGGKCRAFIADPVVVDELCDYARVTGHPLFEKVSIFHALNQKAVARQYAKDQNKKYEDLDLIVVHLGGGVSVGAHQKGKVIDVNQALDGDGPFSPERSGTLPSNQLMDLCFSGKYTKADVKKMIKGEGGFVAYLGTNDAYDVEMKAEAGDEKAKFYFEALAYQVAKEVGAMSAVLSGNVDAILLTGGIAHSKPFNKMVSDRVQKIAPIKVYPGEDEMSALAMNGLMALNKEVEVKEYKD